MRSAVSPVRLDEEAQATVTGPPWRVGVVPPGSGPRGIDAALEEAARPFACDGYRQVARIPEGLQLERPRRTSIPVRILAVISWFASALFGSLIPFFLLPIGKAPQPIYLWVDRAGDVWAVREQVLRPIEHRA
jgi:hypothetical protein